MRLLLQKVSLTAAYGPAMPGTCTLDGPAAAAAAAAASGTKLAPEVPAPRAPGTWGSCTAAADHTMSEPQTH